MVGPITIASIVTALIAATIALTPARAQPSADELQKACTSGAGNVAIEACSQAIERNERTLSAPDMPNDAKTKATTEHGTAYLDRAKARLKDGQREAACEDLLKARKLGANFKLDEAAARELAGTECR